MAYKLIISPNAEMHIDNIVAYVAVELSNPEAAKSILSDLENGLSVLEEFAESFSYCEDVFLSYKKYRKYKLKNHNYIIVYSVVDNVVKISGVFHTLENFIEKL